MIEIISISCLVGALVILYVLSVIDLRERLLPNELVMGFATLGIVFHLSTYFIYESLTNIVLGAFIGGGILYAIRTVANAIYKDDTLGLGDVKLLVAAGLWLGPQSVLVAMTIGALCGLLHGLWIALYTKIKSKVSVNLSKLSIPAGPGFAIGIAIAGVLKFWTITTVLWP